MDVTYSVVSVEPVDGQSNKRRMVYRQRIEGDSGVKSSTDYTVLVDAVIAELLPVGASTIVTIERVDMTTTLPPLDEIFNGPGERLRWLADAEYK